MSLSSEKTGLDELPVREKGGCSDGERRGDGAEREGKKLKNREREHFNNYCKLQNLANFML